MNLTICHRERRGKSRTVVGRVVGRTLPIQKKDTVTIMDIENDYTFTALFLLRLNLLVHFFYLHIVPLRSPALTIVE